MFAWYRQSAKCYAYLSDVGKKEEPFGLEVKLKPAEAPEQHTGRNEANEIKSSRWFTRAWTLQELLAPSSVRRGAEPGQEFVGMEFFSAQWTSLGTKLDLKRIIASATGISEDYLTGAKSLESASISMRMSWAAERRATRAEDVAYSLLGIFDVNMPLLYGEGKVKAFRRLQEEIMKISEDETLFAWESTELTADPSSGDALASDPRDFSEARDLLPFASDEPVVPYALTHRGLRIWLRTHMYSDEIRPIRSPVMLRSPFKLYAAVLRCHLAHDFNNVVVIPLSHVTANLYIRDTTTNVGLLPVGLLSRFQPINEVYIRNSRTTSISNSVRRRFGFLIRNVPRGLRITKAFPKEFWNMNDRIVQGEGNAQGLRSWTASLELSADKTSLLPPNHSTFISLGCRQEINDSEVKSWCYMSDSIWLTGTRNLEDFLNSTVQKHPKSEVRRFRDGRGSFHRLALKIVVSLKMVFGQHMFVLDIEYSSKDSSAVVLLRARPEE
jgi:hypothetical protein